jgi:hypothetical protein
MARLNLFNAMALYHIKNSLPNCMKFFENGKIKDLYNDGYFNEGQENDAHKGFLVVSDGKDVLEKLVNDDAIEDKDSITYRINSHDELFNYLNSQKDKDGAYVFDSYNNKITRVMFNRDSDMLKQRLKNNHKGEYDLNQKLPYDFLLSNCCSDFKTIDVGSKTRVATQLTHAYDHLKAVVLKRTGYGDLAIGRVVYVLPNGVNSSMHFEYKPSLNGITPFVDSTNKIAAYLKKYENNVNERPALVSKDIVGQNYFQNGLYK